MFYMMANFNFNLDNFPSVEEAENHYLGYHVPLAKRLPGLRQYVVGRVAGFGQSVAGRFRSAFLAFDSPEALRAAYRSDVGRELRADEKRLITDAILTFVDSKQMLP